jgi:hypothetical protein
MTYHLSFSSNMKRKNSKLNASSTSAQDDGEFIKKPTDGLRTPNQLSASVIGFFLSAFFASCNFPHLQDMIHDFLHAHSVLHLHGFSKQTQWSRLDGRC